MLAIWYPRGLDPSGLLTDQYVRTLRALAMPATALRNDSEWLILARKDTSTPLPLAKDLAAHMHLDAAGPGTGPYQPVEYDVADDPQFVPITDDRPYLAGNVRYILSVAQVGKLFALAAGLTAAAGAAVWLALRRPGDPQIPRRPYAAVGALAILIGANFLLVEHALVIALFRRTFVYDDALTLAVVTFLIFSGLGSLGGSLAPKRWLYPIAVVGFGILLLSGHRLSLSGVILAAAPVAIATGTFFPALFDRAAANPLAVFALDAIGAGLGAVLATFVPILWGFGTLFVVAGCTFGLTAAADALFHTDRRSAITMSLGRSPTIH
jgi:hypothetical protein